MGVELRFKIVRKISQVCASFVAIWAVTLAIPMGATEAPEQTIDYLIRYVENSKVTFIRNGTEHTPAQAADHIKAKYAHFKKDIQSPEDFIRLCASKSLLTGKPYQVRTSNGKQVELSEWLTQALNDHRKSSP